MAKSFKQCRREKMFEVIIAFAKITCPEKNFFVYLQKSKQNNYERRNYKSGALYLCFNTIR